MSKYDCLYLDCDNMMHMTQCLKKRVKRDFLEEEFEKAGFRHPWVASYYSSNCTECDEANSSKSHDLVTTSKEYEEIEADLMAKLRSTPMTESQLGDEYMKLERKMIDVSLAQIEDNVKSLRKIVYEDYNKQDTKEQEEKA